MGFDPSVSKNIKSLTDYRFVLSKSMLGIVQKINLAKKKSDIHMTWNENLDLLLIFT